MVDSFRSVRTHRQKHEPLHDTSGNVNSRHYTSEEVSLHPNRCLRERHVYAEDGYHSETQLIPETEVGGPVSQSSWGISDDHHLSDHWQYGTAVTSILSCPQIRIVGDVPYSLQDVKDDTGRFVKKWERYGPGKNGKYDNYKKRKRRDRNKITGQEVWPPHLEEIFMKVCIDIPPILGKKKIPIKQADGQTKLCGRNELIAYKIEQQTGINLHRKQISSHIQVIKKMLKEDNSPFLKYVVSDPELIRRYDSKSITYDAIAGILIITDPTPTSQMAENSIHHARMDPRTQHPAPKLNHASRPSSDRVTNAVQEIDFVMGFAKKPGGELDQKCTMIQSQMGAQTQALPTALETNGNLFPNLDALLHNDGSPACDFVLFESNINVEDMPADRVHLNIIFNVDLNCDREYRDWQVQTTFNIDRGAKQCEVIRELIGERIEQSKIRLAGIPLHSRWWAQLFTIVINRRTAARRIKTKALESLCHPRCHCDTCEATRADAQRESDGEDEECRRFFRDMSIIQEISAIPSNGHRKSVSPRERIAMFLWKFRRTSRQEAATTTWRRLTRPSGVQESPSTLPEPSTILASSSTNYVDQQNDFSRLQQVRLDPDFLEASDITVTHPNWEIERAYPASRELLGRVGENSIGHHEGYQLQPELTPTDSTFSSNTIGQSSNTSYTNPLQTHRLGQESLDSGFGYSNDLILHGHTYPLDFHQDRQYAAVGDHSFMTLEQCYPMNAGAGIAQDSTSFSQFNLEDFSFDAITDPSMLDDFGHTHIQLNLGSQSAVDAHTSQGDYHQNSTYSSLLYAQVERDQDHHSSSMIHAPQPRRLISPTHLLSSSTPNLSHHLTQNPEAHSTPLQGNVDELEHRSELELCADEEVLANLAGHQPMHFEAQRVAQDQIKREVERLERNRIRHDGGEHQGVELFQQPNITQASSVSDFDKINAEQANIHIAQQPQMALLPSAHIAESQEREDNDHHSPHRHHRSQASWQTTTSMDDNAWVRDFAIAQLEGMIEHANAMDPALAAATLPPSYEANVAVLEHVTETEIKNALGIDSDDTIAEDVEGEGRVLGEIDGEHAAEQIGSDWEHVESNHEGLEGHTTVDDSATESEYTCE